MNFSFCNEKLHHKICHTHNFLYRLFIKIADKYVSVLTQKRIKAVIHAL